MNKTTGIIIAIIVIVTLTAFNVAAINSSMNTGTINLLNYNASSPIHSDTLRVWGEVPEGAVTADVKLRKLDTSIVTTVSVPVTTLGNNSNTYNAFITNISSYAPEMYQVVVFFSNASGTMPGYAVSAPFNDLFIEDLSAQIDVLDAQVDNNTANITYLQGQVQDIWDSIAQLNATIGQLNDTVNQLESRLNDVEDRLYGISGDPTLIWDILSGYCSSNSSQCSMSNFCGDLSAEIGTNFIGSVNVSDLGLLSFLLGTSNEADLNMIWNACQMVKLNSMNHGTIFLDDYYDSNNASFENVLIVYGEAPEGATNVKIQFFNLSNNYLYLNRTTPVVSYANNSNYYQLRVNHSDLQPVRYEIYANFYNGTTFMDGYAVSVIYDDLYLLAMVDQFTTQIDALNQSIQNNSADIATLNDTLHAIQANVTTLQTNVTNIQGNITYIYGLIDALDVRITSLENAIDLMNHGDVDLVWNEGTMNLRAKIKFPLGATQATLMAYDQNDSLAYTYPTSIIPGVDNYKNVDWNVSTWDKQVYTIKVKFMNDSGAKVDRWATALFDDLYLLALKERLTQLNQTLQEYQNLTNENLTAIWNEFNATWDAINNNSADIDWIKGQIADLWAGIGDLENMSLITFDYYSELYSGPSLDLYGYAPGNAQSVRIDFYGSRSGADYHQCVSVNQTTSPEFSQYFDLSTWEIDSYAIEGTFYDGPSCTGNDVEPMAYGNTFDDLLNDWLHKNGLGFGLMDAQTFEVWNPQDSFTRKISWAFTAPESGWYWFELVNPTSNNGENISKVFAGGTPYWINSHETRYFKSRNVRFPPEEGSYKVKLKAHNFYTGKTTKSNAFRLIVDDLSQPWPLFGVTTVAVTPDVNSYSGGVYWTNNTAVTIQGILGNETDWKSNSCELRNYKKHSPDQWEQPLYQEFDTGSSYACTWDLSLGDFTPIRNNGTEQFDMSICGTPLGAQVNCSPITIGYDTEAPKIYEDSLNPGTRDAISGLWNFSANISDNGVVKNVTFVLTNKTNANMTCMVGPVNYNNTTDLWEVANFNTTDQNCTPDGYYNFTVYAQDYAGNVATLMIDPMIDNTPPVVLNTTAVTGSYGENGGFSVSAQVTDNLAGVTNATAEFVPYTCNDTIAENVSVCDATYKCTNKTYDNASAVESPLNLSSCNEWSDATNTTCINGNWSGSLNGTDLSPDVYYEVRVHATDRAGNENNAANINSSLSGIYSQEGYIVTVNNVNTVAGVQFTLSGSVVGTNGTYNLTNENVTLSPWETKAPLIVMSETASFSPSETFGEPGKYTVTADYTPNANCPGEVYTGSAIVSVAAVQSNGGGGGGGIACGPVWQCGSWSACSSSGTQTRSCTDKNNCGYDAGKPVVTQSCTYTAPAVTKGSSDTNTNAGTGNEDTKKNTNAGNTEPTTPTTPTPTNGVTGAVTGGGFGSIAWLLALLGLIVLVLGGYFIIRRRK